MSVTLSPFTFIVLTFVIPFACIYFGYIIGKVAGNKDEE